MAFRVRDGVRLHPEYHEIKEDVQYSLMHCELDDKVLRLNGLGVKAKPYCAFAGSASTVKVGAVFRSEHARMCSVCRPCLVRRSWRGGAFSRLW